MHNARSLVYLAAFVCALAGCLAPASPTTAQDATGDRPNLTIRQFMGELSNHGEWFTLDEWGWAWQPYDIEPWWVPYTHGEWQYTNQGPYWVSFKAYGWAVFHYGRWMLAEDRGWVWIPDTQWGPGFVCWRYGKGYLGWAPMPPEKPGDVGIATGECDVPATGWSFILAHYAFYRNVEPYIVPRARSVNLMEVSTTKTDYQRGGMGWGRSKHPASSHDGVDRSEESGARNRIGHFATSDQRFDGIGSAPAGKCRRHSDLRSGSHRQSAGARSSGSTGNTGNTSNSAPRKPCSYQL